MINVTTLFGPEHGFHAYAQDMESVETGHIITRAGKTPIYSLYGDDYDSLKPTDAMLQNLDVMIIDLQDIGSRYYTYIYTMAFMMEACARNNISVIVCDRPNPINGINIEGSLIDEGFHSFVGHYSLPNRHGMTIGELALYFNTEEKINCDLTVVQLEGWRRLDYFDETGLTWHNPSPNMRSLEAAILYPGLCLIEGTNLSEGRGTDFPFSRIGAPYVDATMLVETLNQLKLAGVSFDPFSFTPTFQKWMGMPCDGLKLAITDRRIFKPYQFGLALIWALGTLFQKKDPKNRFKWRTEKYEFVDDKPAIDLLTGSSAIREAIDKGVSFSELIETVGSTPTEFLETRNKYLLY